MMCLAIYISFLSLLSGILAALILFAIDARLFRETDNEPEEQTKEGNSNTYILPSRIVPAMK